MFKLCIGISTQNGLSQTLGFITEGSCIIANLTVAKYYTHAATLMGLGLTEDTDTSAILFQSLIEIVVEQ
jgi:hypothetical protein